MEKKLVITICAILFAFPLCAYAASMTFTSDANIQAGDSWSSVSIYDTPPAHTTVTMTGGSVLDGMYVHDAATLNISGGSVSPGGLTAYDQSTVNISGGLVHGLGVSSNATASISNNASVSMASTGGSGTLNVYSGTVSQLYSWENSIVTIYDGVINTLGTEDSSILNLRGGSVGYLNSGFPATINVFGYDLAKTNIGGIYGDGQVTGFWQNGLPFTINLSGSGTYSAINLIPEPTTLLLFGLGALLLKKSR